MFSKKCCWYYLLPEALFLEQLSMEECDQFCLYVYAKLCFLVDLKNSQEAPVNRTHLAEWPPLEDGGEVDHPPVVVGGAAAPVQHLVIRGLEQAVPDVVPAHHRAASSLATRAAAHLYMP